MLGKNPVIQVGKTASNRFHFSGEKKITKTEVGKSWQITVKESRGGGGNQGNWPAKLVSYLALGKLNHKDHWPVEPNPPHC